MRTMLIIVFAALALVTAASSPSRKQGFKVDALPGLSAGAELVQYAGVLVNKEQRLRHFFWLFEAEHTSSRKQLVYIQYSRGSLYSPSARFAEGPGCLAQRRAGMFEPDRPLSRKRTVPRARRSKARCDLWCFLLSVGLTRSIVCWCRLAPFQLAQARTPRVL
jgi:hypothetical protein